VVIVNLITILLGGLFEVGLKFNHNLQKFLVSVLKLRAEFKPPRADKTLLTLRLSEARVALSLSLSLR